MKGYISVVLAILMMTTSSMLIATAGARSIHNVENFDLVNDTFSPQQEWSLSTKKGFSDDVAEYTSVMVTDGHLTFDHNRSLNTQSSIIWSTTNSTIGHGSATGSPDNYVAVSSGPEIIVGGFQYTGMESYPILSIALVMTFNIPNPLYSDSVRASIEVDGMNHLVKEFSHTQSGLFYMTSPYWSKDVSSQNYTWQDLGNANVKVDYASEGGTDDSEVRLDAVGFNVVYRAPWFGIETAVAEQTFNGDWPVLELNTLAGTHSAISMTPCGLENSSASPGVWTSAVLSRPYDQSWGRLHVTADGNTSWKVTTSDDGENWSSSTTHLVGQVLPVSEFLQLQGTIFSGCISSVRIDINDPTLNIDWQIAQSLDGLANTSWLEVKVSGVEVYRQNLTALGTYSLEIPVGGYLPSDDSSVDISVAIVFSWASDGQPATTVVQVDSMSVSGGYALEWDEDPECMAIGDLELLEDGVGRLLAILNTCSDDRGNNTDLQLSVGQDRYDIVTVDVVGDQIRVSQKDEQSGDTIVTATVTDAAGNYWKQNFTVIVGSVNDAPYLVESLPATVIVSLGQVYLLPLSIADVDSPTLSVDASYSWASWNPQEGRLELNPTVAGEYDLQIAISDGELSVVRNVNVEVMATADLVVDEVTIIGNLSSGSEVEVQVHIRNDGQSNAYFLTVKCEADGNLLKVVTVPEIRSGMIQTAICPWVVPMDDDTVMLTIELDGGDDIFESNEDNNAFSRVLSIEVVSTEPPTQVDSTFAVGQAGVWGGTILALLLLVGLFWMFGPAPVRKIE
ncbi:MAG: hypothetical protein CXX80_11685 [Methanobacteriota archaeon]|nr:MAG: hypothetical protein CXX80_11685 [Euryarchaeota archaeon]